MKELQEKEYQAELLDMEISSVNNQIQNEQDEVNIIFWKDYLADLNYHLNKTNCDIYLLRQKIKKSENGKIFQTN